MIIGLTGKAGAGKNTVAEMMWDICDFYTQMESFAMPVKEVYTAITGEPYEDSLEWKNAKPPGWEFTRREMLQKIGTDCMRNGLHPDVWVRALMHKYEYYNKSCKATWIITDVRFPNEVEAILKRGIVIRVIRPGFDSGTPTHESETALDDYEFPTIINYGTIEQLRESVKDAINQLVIPFLNRDRSGVPGGD